MKKTYKYLAFAFGMIFLDNSCYATQEKQPPKQENNANQQENVYQQILAAIPPDNPERRNAFLAEVCRALATEEGEKKDNKGKTIGHTTIKDIVCDKLKEKDSTLTADSPEVKEKLSQKATDALDALQKEKTWNDDSSGLEDVKDAVQEFVQVQGGGFFVGISDQYMQQLDGYYDDDGEQFQKVEGDFEKFVSALQKLDLSKVDVIKSLVSSLNVGWIGCPGCALTSDLIMDITRRAVSRLSDNPNDKDVLDNLKKLYCTISQGNYSLAHKIPNLPAIATKVARNFRTKRIKDFSAKDIGNMIEAVKQNEWQKFGFTVFQIGDLGTTLGSLSEAVGKDIRTGVRKAIPSEELKEKLLEGIRKKGTGNQLEQSINSLVEAIDKTRDVEDIVCPVNNPSSAASSSSKPQTNVPDVRFPLGKGKTPQPTSQQPGKSSSIAAKIAQLNGGNGPVNVSNATLKPYTPTIAQPPFNGDSSEEKYLDQQYEEKSENPGVKVWVLRTHSGKPELVVDIYRNGKSNEYTVDSEGNCLPGLTADDPTLVQVNPVNGYPNMHDVSISDGGINNKTNLTCKFENNKCGVMLRDTNYNGKLVVEADLVGKAGNANVNDLVIKSNDDYFVNYGRLNTSNLCIFAHKINNYGIFNGQPTALMPTVNNVYEWLNAGLDSIQADSNKFHNHPLAICNAEQITIRYIGESIFEGSTHVDTIDSDNIVTLGQRSKGYYCDIHKIKAQQANIYVKDGNLNYSSMDRYNWNSGSTEASHVNEIVDTSDQQMNPIVKQ